MNNLKPQFLRYWLAMNASAVKSAAHSVRTFFGMAGIHVVEDSVPSLSPGQFAAVFVIFFGRGVLEYLDEHPIPAGDEAACLKAKDESLLTSAATSEK